MITLCSIQLIWWSDTLLLTQTDTMIHWHIWSTTLRSIENTSLWLIVVCLKQNFKMQTKPPEEYLAMIRTAPHQPTKGEFLAMNHSLRQSKTITLTLHCWPFYHHPQHSSMQRRGEISKAHQIMFIRTDNTTKRTSQLALSTLSVKYFFWCGHTEKISTESRGSV